MNEMNNMAMTTQVNTILNEIEKLYKKIGITDPYQSTFSNTEILVYKDHLKHLKQLRD